MKKALGLALLAGAAVVGTAGVASAEVSGNVALTSNYVWRGLSQSDGGSAIQGGFDYGADMFYAGVWGSSVDAAGTGVAGGEMELDAYVGFTPSLGPVNFDLGVIGYFYPDAAADGDWVELLLGASYSPVEPLTLGALVGLSDDVYNSGEDSTYLEANVSYAITDAFAISGAFGNFDLGAPGDYDAWNLGVTYSYAGFGFDLRYHEADIAGVDEEVSFSISRAL